MLKFQSILELALEELCMISVSMLLHIDHYVWIFEHCHPVCTKMLILINKSARNIFHTILYVEVLLLKKNLEISTFQRKGRGVMLWITKWTFERYVNLCKSIFVHCISKTGNIPFGIIKETDSRLDSKLDIQGSNLPQVHFLSLHIMQQSIIMDLSWHYTWGH